MSKAAALALEISRSVPNTTVTHNLTGGPMTFCFRGVTIFALEKWLLNGKVREEWEEPIKAWSTFERNCEGLKKYLQHIKEPVLITIRETNEFHNTDRGSKSFKVLRIGILPISPYEAPHEEL